LTSISALITHADAGKIVRDIEDRGRVRIAAVRREGGGVLIASGDMVLEEGDEINAVIAPEAISAFAQRFSGAAPGAKMSA
jgi:Trk K+ transport system NAD-binding subunit